MILRRAFPADLPDILALQEAAYAPNRDITGNEPLPLTWDYGRVLNDWDCWVLVNGAGIAGLLILQCRPDDLYIENLSVSPHAQRQGFGRRLMAKAHHRAREQGRRVLRLLTNERMTRNWHWYQREGFGIELIEEQDGRRIVHMAKTLAAPSPEI